MKRRIVILLFSLSLFLSGCQQTRPGNWELYCELKESIGTYGVLEYLLRDLSENDILEYLYTH